MPQPTVDYLHKGKVRRVHRSRRDRLAQALHVPADWLSGSDDLAGILVERTPLSWRALWDAINAAAERDGLSTEVDGALARLTHPAVWELALLGRVRKGDDLERRDALSRFLGTLLGPWLDGRATLDEKTLRALDAALLRGRPAPEAT